MPLRRLDKEGRHYEFSEPLRDEEIETVAANPLAEAVQTWEPVSPQTWGHLNELLFARRPDIEAGFYGSGDRDCDLGFLSRLANVRRFAADCHRGGVTGIEHLADLPHLERLTIGVAGLDSFAWLELVSSGLRELSLGATRSRRPDLASLARLKTLETVSLDRQQRNIEVLSELGELQDLTLHSISVADLDFLRPLERLWSLDIELGGTRNLSAIAGMTSIKYLSIWQVRGLSDVGVIGELPGLQYLYLQSLPRVHSLPALTRCTQLRRVMLINTRGLRDLSPLQLAPALEEFALVQGYDPDDATPVLRNPALRCALGGFGSAGKNHRFDLMLRDAGIAGGYRWTRPFVFR